MHTGAGGSPPTSAGVATDHDCLTLHIAGRREVRWHFERAADGEAVSVAVEGERSVDDGSIAHEWALAGGGIVYKSAIDVRADLRTGALVALLPDWLGQRYALHAVLPSNRFVPARVRALVHHLAQCCAALAAEESAQHGGAACVALP